MLAIKNVNYSAAYAGLRRSFERASASYDGTRAAQAALQKIGVKIEKLVHGFAEAAGHGNVYTAEFNLIQATGFNPDKTYYQRLHAALRNLGGHFNQSWEQGGVDKLLGELSARGIIINSPKAQLILPREARPFTSNGGGQSFEIKTEPRLIWVINALLAAEITTNEIFIDPGQPEPGRMRKEPYVLVNLPGRGDTGRQIAVCGQVGETTFLSDIIYAPEFYAKIDKDDLKALPGMRALDHRNHDTWLAEIVKFAQEGHTPARPEKIHIAAAARARRPTEFKPNPPQAFTKILDLMMAGEAGKRKFISSSTSPIPGWPEWNGSRLDDYLRKNFSYGGITGLIRAMVVEQARKWLTAHPGGTLEDMLQDNLPDYPSVPFTAIDEASQNMLTTGKTSLARVLDEAGVFKLDILKPENITPEIAFAKILDLMMAGEEGNRKFISSSSGPIPGWAEWDGLRLDNHLRNNFSCGGISGLIRTMVVEQAHKWLTAHPGGTLEDMLKDHLPDHPSVPFAAIDDAWQNMGKGKTSLGRVLDEAGVFKLDILKPEDITPEIAFAKILDLMMTGEKGKRKFISSTTGLIFGWAEWDGLRLDNHLRDNFSYGRIPGLIRAMVVEQAHKWLTAHPGGMLEDMLKDHLPYYPTVPFAAIDQAWQNMPTRGKTSLGRVLDEAGVFKLDILKPENITPDIAFAKILDLMMAGEEGSRKFMSQNTGPISGWAEWNGSRLDKHLRNNFSYGGISGLIRAMVVEQARKWLTAHPGGTLEEMLQDNLPDYPSVPFAAIDEAWQNNQKTKQLNFETLLRAQGMEFDAAGRLIKQSGAGSASATPAPGFD